MREQLYLWRKRQPERDESTARSLTGMKIRVVSFGWFFSLGVANAFDAYLMHSSTTRVLTTPVLAPLPIRERYSEVRTPILRKSLRVVGIPLYAHLHVRAGSQQQLHFDLPPLLRRDHKGGELGVRPSFDVGATVSDAVSSARSRFAGVGALLLLLRLGPSTPFWPLVPLCYVLRT